MSDLNLLPCPFCGGEAEYERIGTLRYSTIVVCTDCGARHESGDAGEIAGVSWNNRPAENKIKADAVRDAHDHILDVLVKQYTTPDQHCFEVLGMLSVYADKLERSEI